MRKVRLKLDEKKRFHDFLDEYIDFFDEMVELQKEQLAAVLSSEIQRVDKCAATLQVYLKKLNMMEQKRIDLQTAAGYKNMSFKEIIAILPEEQKQEYSKLFDMLGKRISEVVFYNDKSQEKVKADLKMHSSLESSSVYNAKKEQRAAGMGRGLLDAKA